MMNTPLFAMFLLAVTPIPGSTERERSVAAAIASHFASDPVVTVDRSGPTPDTFHIHVKGQMDHSPPVLILSTRRVGRFDRGEEVLGTSGNYVIPQAIVTVRYIDPDASRIECGYALLEPELDSSESLWFGNARRVLSGVSLPIAVFCGDITKVQDSFGGSKERPGDEIHEVVVDAIVLERQHDRNNEQLSKVQFVVDVSGTAPVILHRSDPLRYEGDVPLLYLELLADNQARIRTSYERPAEPELPDEVASLRDKYPALKVVKVEQVAGETFVTLLIPRGIAKSRILRDMMDLGLTPSPNKNAELLDSEDAFGNYPVTFRYITPPQATSP